MMSRLVKKSPSLCTDLPLDSADTCNKLHLLRQLLRSCFGPTGRLKQVHNNIGGHVVTTSTSSVLLPAISSSQPFINLIKTSILNHVSRFSDCGLFAAILCLSLIEQAKRSGLGGNVAIAVNKRLLGLCTSYLQREDCACKVKLDFCSSHNLIRLARSILSSKPACVLTEPEALHISKLAVQAFLLTVPCSSAGVVRLGKIVTVCVEGHSALNSAVFPGLLVDLPDVFCPDKVESLRSNPLRVVLFGASLAGDLSELGDGTIEVHPGVDADSQVLDQLLELGKRAVKDEVKLFVCQKVIHPVLQQYLRSHGIMVIERLGIALMEPLTQLTGNIDPGWINYFKLISYRQALENSGFLNLCQDPKVTSSMYICITCCPGRYILYSYFCAVFEVLFNFCPFQQIGAQPVATLHTTIPAKAYGKVRDLAIRQFGSKTMLHLHPPGESAICTMVLCHRNETMLSELKVR